MLKGKREGGRELDREGRRDFLGVGWEVLGIISHFYSLALRMPGTHGRSEAGVSGCFCCHPAACTASLVAGEGLDR